MIPITVPRGVSRPSGSFGAEGSTVVGCVGEDFGTWADATKPTNRKTERAMRKAQAQLCGRLTPCLDSLWKAIHFVLVARGHCPSVGGCEAKASTPRSPLCARRNLWLSNRLPSVSTAYPRTARTPSDHYFFESPIANPPALPASRSWCGSRRPKISISFATTPVHPVW